MDDCDRVDAAARRIGACFRSGAALQDNHLPLGLTLRELDRRTGRLPGWSRMEIRWPWSPSSEAVSAVFSLPPQRITALPASFGLGLLLANVRFAVPEAVLPSICVSAKLPG